MAGEFEFRDGIAAAQIPIFVLFLFFGVLFRYQHKDGWFGLSFFAIIRLIGASCRLVTIHSSSRGVWATVFVCESLGLVLLTYILLGLLRRVNTFVNALTDWHFRIPDIICWAGIGISIADYVLASRKKNGMEPGALTQAGVGLYVGLYFSALFLFILLARRWEEVPSEERRSLICVGTTIPFMVVRMAYTITYVATGDKKYSAVTGDALIYLFMTLLMEISILSAVVWTIFGLRSLAKKADEPGKTEAISASNGPYELINSEQG